MMRKMKVLIATDIRVFTYKGKFFANQKHSTILRRYYNAFGSIVLFSRFVSLDNGAESYDDISDIIDSIVNISSLSGVLLGKYNRSVAEAMSDCDLVVCRCPAISAFFTARIARKMGKKYIAESMGDPWDAYWNHSLLGKAIAPYMYFMMKKTVWNADYNVYVTTEYLQNRYPCKNDSVAVSNVLINEITDSVLNHRFNRIRALDRKKITLMTTAAVDVYFKGQQYVIRSIPLLNKEGIRVKYFIVGEGDNHYLRGVAERYGVLDQVEFTGRLPLDQVLNLLDSIDIYVQPSLQEGLPRSVIEAMSRACACIGARTAGIPELLDDDMVVRRKSPKAIAETIIAYLELTVEQKERVAERNWKEAGKYEKSVLDDRRNAFYHRIASEL